MQAAILSPARWSSFRLSKQFVAMALAQRGHPVLYVDPPLSPLSTLRQRERVVDAQAPADEIVDAGVRLWRPRVIPGQNSAVSQAVNARWLRRGVRRRIGDPELVIAFSLESRGLLRILGGRRVYYCTDSFEDLPGTDAARVRGQEDRLLESADVVIACSKPLCDQLRERGTAPVYVPHACDPSWLVPTGAPPPELADLPRPIVGYVGSLNFRIDVDLLRAAHRAARPGTLVVIGGAFGPEESAATRSFLATPGVVTVGHRPAATIQDYVAALDVGLVPYSDAPFNRKSFPIKVAQYLAAGTPVVSSSNGATDELGDHVAIADHPDAFEAAVREAIDGADEARDARRKVAASRTWGDVVDEVLATVTP